MTDDEDGRGFRTLLQARLADRFVVRRLLGEGGMGVVFDVFDEARGESVALKTLERVEPRGIYALKREFRSLADLVHPNLVRLHELFSDDGRWFFTMQKVDGVSFLEHVRDSDAALRAALPQLVAGVRAIHRAGKLHRDLKPSNVLVSDGHVIILDFGLATPVSPEGDHSIELAAVGTPAYMAPEQLQPVGACPASDWYALGVMLYEALTGEQPFRGSTAELLSQKHARKLPKHPRVLVPTAPEDLADLAMRLLDPDPARRPGESAILEAVGQPLKAEAPVDAPPFVGRERELAELAEAFATSRRGDPVLVCLEGPSGIGKSALLAHFIARISGDPVILVGRCYERESVPFKAFDAVIDALSRHLCRVGSVAAARLAPRYVSELCRVFPVLARVPALVDAVPAGSAEPQEVRRRAFAALKELFVRMTDRQPVVVAIDDLQWGDADSAALLAQLMAPPGPPPILWLTSYRADDVARSKLLSALGELAEDVRKVVLTPLTRTESLELAHEFLGGDDQSAIAIAEEAAGSPFFIGELARAAREHRGSQTLAEVIAARLATLPSEACALLEVVAIAGRPLSLSVALAAAALPDDTPLPLLRSASFLRATGRGDVETYHDRIREAVTSSLDEVACRVRYGALAAALESKGDAAPDLLAHYYQEAGDRDRTFHYACVGAAHAAELFAFDRAAALYRWALELAPPDSAGELSRSLADALANGGRGLEAAETYLATSAHVDQQKALGLQMRAADQYLRAGYINEGLSLLDPVLLAVGLRMPRGVWSAVQGILLQRIRHRVGGLDFVERQERDILPDELLRIDVCYSTAIVMATVDPVRGAYFGSLGLSLALRAGERKRVARALVLQSMYHAAEGDSARAQAFTAPAASLSAEAEHVVLADAVAASVAGRWSLALERCDRFAQLARQGGRAYELAIAEVFALAALFYLGDFHGLRSRGETFFRDAQARGDLFAQTMFRTTYAPLLFAMRDEPELAKREVDDALARWRVSGWQVQHHSALYNVIQVLHYAGDYRAAWERLTLDWKRHNDSMIRRLQNMRIFSLHLEASAAIAAAAGGIAPRALLKRAARAARRLDRERMPWPRAWAELDRGGIAVVRGDIDEAIVHYRAAAHALDALEMKAYAAAARWRLGELLRGDDGDREVHEAEAYFRAQGVARPDRFVAMLAPSVQTE